jgi:hypothetical protein
MQYENLDCIFKSNGSGRASRKTMIERRKGLRRASPRRLSSCGSSPSGPFSADDPADVIDVVRSVPRVMPPVTAASALDVADSARGCPPAVKVVVERVGGSDIARTGSVRISSHVYPSSAY